MAKYTSGRQKNLKVGISSYSENVTSLEVIGNGYFTGIVTAGYFRGDGSGLTNLGGSTAVSYASSAGIATYATTAGIATYATTAGVATALQNARTFQITGDVVSSAISFDGSGNVSLASTIQPNSVGLGTDTTGDYVQSVSGTSNQITVTGGTGEGSTPTLSLPSNLVLPQDVTVTRDLQVNRNLNVTGNITIGGTTAFVNVQELKVTDPDLVLGFRTDSFGNDVSNDTTSNHGGIAVASTEGSPLVSLYNPGIGESTLATYKKIMWFKSGSFAGLGTDAWLINYAVGIGSTQFPSGTRLAAGSVQFTERDLSVVRNINASGVITASSFSGNASSATYATAAGIATYATTAGISTVAEGLTGTPNLNVGVITATSFSGSGVALTGIVTTIIAGTGITIGPTNGTGQVTIYSTAQSVPNYALVAGIATYATSAGIATYATTAGIATYATSAGIATYATSAGISSALTSTASVNTSGIITATSFSGSGVALTGIVTSIVAGTGITIGPTNGTGQVTIYSTASSGAAAYADKSGISTSVIGGIASVTQLSVSGLSTFSGLTTFTSSAYFNGAYFGDNNNLYFGNANDLRIYHSGGNSYIKDVGRGDLILASDGNGISLRKFADADQYMAEFLTSGPVKLYYNNVNKFETLSIGATVTGTFFSDQISVGGTVTATTFSGSHTGSGTNLTGIVTSIVAGTGITIGPTNGTGQVTIYSTASSIATYATSSGVSTSVIGGISSVTQLSVSGISTVGFLTATSIWNAGITTSSRITLTGAGDTTTGGGQIYLNGATGNRIDFVGVGVAAPSFATRSAGTKIVLYPNVDVSLVDYAFGVESNTLWYSIPNVSSTRQHRWYAGTTQLADLKGTGELLLGTTTVTGTASQTLQVTGGAYVSGSVGIGITNPGQKLVISGGLDASNQQVRFVNSGSGDLYIKHANLVSSLQAAANIQLALGSNDVEVVRINNSSQVGIGTTNPTSKLTVQGDTLVSGVVTASSFSGNASSATYATSSGIATYATSAGIATYATLSGLSTYATSSGIATYATSSGIATYATTAGIATYATTAGVATALQNARNFSITGNFVTATAISFDGTGNVALAATIPLDAIELGTYTTGDYVRNISGTSNQITVTSGTGEGSTPTLSIPSQFTAPQDVTVTRDLQVNRNLNVTGNITLGGTTAFINVQELKVADPDIVLGVRTDGSDNDISNDTTANHGGIAVASTEGNPLVSLYNPGIGESTLPTYKKIMWFKAGSFTGLGTDSWLINYAVGIGSTQFPSGTRLAAGSVQFTENDLVVIRNINASGVVTALSFSGNASSATYATTAGIATYAENAGVATYATNAGTSTSVIGGISSVTSLFVSGISTLTQISAGGTTGLNQYVLSSTGTGLSWQPVTSVGGGTLSGLTVQDEGSIVGSANSVSTFNFVGSNIVATSSGIAATITISDNLVGTSLSISGISTLGTVRISSGIISATSGVVTYYGDGSKLSGVAADYVPNAGLATYVKGGLAGNVLYQSAPDITAFLANGSTGTILQSNGDGNAPSWVAAAPANAISGLTVQDEGSIVGSANSISTFNFVGENVTATASAGIATITILGSSTNIVGSALSISGISTFRNGPVLIGTATSTGTSGQVLQVAGINSSVYIGGGLGVGVTNNTTAGNIVVSGTVTANSDAKLKINVKTIENALDKVLSLRGVEYDRIDTGDHQIGLIAQEVEKIIPQVVYPKQPAPDYETKSVSYQNIVGLLIEAIKEQEKRILELERKLGEN
jgi:hypothetical protein